MTNQEREGMNPVAVGALAAGGLAAAGGLGWLAFRGREKKAPPDGTPPAGASPQQYDDFIYAYISRPDGARTPGSFYFAPRSTGDTTLVSGYPAPVGQMGSIDWLTAQLGYPDNLANGNEIYIYLGPGPMSVTVMPPEDVQKLKSIGFTIPESIPADATIALLFRAVPAGSGDIPFFGKVVDPRDSSSFLQFENFVDSDLMASDVATFKGLQAEEVAEYLGQYYDVEGYYPPPKKGSPGNGINDQSNGKGDQPLLPNFDYIVLGYVSGDLNAPQLSAISEGELITFLSTYSSPPYQIFLYDGPGRMAEPNAPPQLPSNAHYGAVLVAMHKNQGIPLGGPGIWENVTAERADIVSGLEIIQARIGGWPWGDAAPPTNASHATASVAQLHANAHRGAFQRRSMGYSGKPGRFG